MSIDITNIKVQTSTDDLMTLQFCCQEGNSDQGEQVFRDILTETNMPLNADPSKWHPIKPEFHIRLIKSDSSSAVIEFKENDSNEGIYGKTIYLQSVPSFLLAKDIISHDTYALFNETVTNSAAVKSRAASNSQNNRAAKYQSDFQKTNAEIEKLWNK